MAKMEEQPDDIKLETYQDASSVKSLVKSHNAHYAIFRVHTKQIMVSWYIPDWSVLRVKYIVY